MSLGMDFARRRMMVAFNKELKYIWRVYNVESQLSGETTGTFTLSSSRYKMAASSFTFLSSTLGFSLTNSVQTAAANLKVGDYLVDVSTSSSTSVNGTVLYEITAISGSSTRTISYKSYTSFSEVQGSNLLYEIGSDTMDYPADGIWSGDGLWYVMVKGEREVHVWNVFNVNNNYYTEVIEGNSSGYQYDYSFDYLTYGESYTFNKNTGEFTLNDVLSLGSAIAYQGTLYGMEGSSTLSGDSMKGPVLYSQCSCTADTYNVYHRAKCKHTATFAGTKGSSTGNLSESINRNEYPQDGIQGNYWYVYSHSYVEPFDDR